MIQSPTALPDRRRDRPPLVYLPGMDGTGDLFYRQARQLASQFEIRNFSFNASPVRSWFHLAESVRDRHLADGPAILCGESFGGCLALQVAAQYPDRVAGLIAINSASAFRHNALMWTACHLLRTVPETILNALMEKGLHWLAEIPRLQQEDRQRFLQAMRSVNKKAVLERLHLLQQFDAQTLPLEQFECPTLLLASQRDRILPSVKEARKLARRLPNATLEVLPKSGHACLLERELDLAAIAHTSNWIAPALANCANFG
ncbi:alpha/beta fold hydrolase [Synechococcus sp. PCC 7336]|uniref:alpha/beta fold hydrolase n=1 Tax=Synechococcus sp. PCC 7336 TaxID=195250 RepID=UPI000347AF66|nr:alpha/beta hydrolase [Synechococcus sp. PCC 7336]